MNNYRHVCFKDLDNYIRRDNYFSDFSIAEKKLIIQNLNVLTKSEFQETSGGLVEKTYEEIKVLVDTNSLNRNARYLMTDFQSIYTSNNNEVWGTDLLNPSETYQLLLYPISTNSFDVKVGILKDGVPLFWEVMYDFTQETLLNSVKTKGKITYLKDENNNSAYYDFKNIKFNTAITSNLSGLPYDTVLPMYTFSIINSDGTCSDNSHNAYNNYFDQDCYENVFLGTVKNNHFYGGFKKNLFAKGCEYNRFDWNMYNNTFVEKVSNTEGSIQNSYITSTQFDSSISKTFKMIHTLNDTEPVFVVTYLDGDTLTMQMLTLNQN